MPRIGFWLMWTAWLCCLQYFLLDRWQLRHSPAAPLLVIAPPLLITWLVSRRINNRIHTPSSIFWLGAVGSFYIAVFTSLFLLVSADGILALTGLAVVIGGVLLLRRKRGRTVRLAQGEIFERVRAIARRGGVTVNRVVIFHSPRKAPGAFASRRGAILISDTLLGLLSRQEMDAVIAHEAAHLRPGQRRGIVALAMLVGSTVFLRDFWPEAMVTAPFWPILFVLLWRAIRRFNEFDADATAIQTSGDAEALITALTRVAKAGGLPMHWGVWAGLFVSHPPMTKRFQAIARRSGLSDSRVQELVAMASATPPLPSYSSPFPPPLPGDSNLWTAYLDRSRKQMMVLSRLYPIVAGAAATAVLFLGSADLLSLLARTAAWIAGAIFVFYLLYEVVVGSARARLRRQLPDGEAPGGYLVGFATAAEPRYYEGSYHYDAGVARVDGARLSFQSARCVWNLPASRIRRVWLADGPRHWTPRKTVCLEYLDDEGSLAVVSMQSLERWFWPGTSQAAKDLLHVVEHWRESAANLDGSAVFPPRVTEAVVPKFPLGAVAKLIQVSCAISLCLGYVVSTFGRIDLTFLLAPFLAPAVTAILILFELAPHLEWRFSKSLRSAPATRTAQSDS